MLRICASELGTDWGVLLSKEQEDSVGSVIGVKAAALDERVDGDRRKAALMK
jgi:hypothetical protein